MKGTAGGREIGEELNTLSRRQRLEYNTDAAVVLLIPL
jgi:hypothetical protein